MASRKVSLLILLTLSLLILTVVSLIPSPAQAQADVTSTFPTFSDFLQSVSNGDGGQLQGVYIPSVMALPVVQQVGNSPTYVSPEDETLTQFGMATQFGMVGLLAHNDLSGKYFSALLPGQVLYLVYGSGEINTFIVTQILRLRAHEPNNPYSYFTDLDTHQVYSAEDLFRQVYMGDPHVTFQTCIAQDDQPSWGRLFVIAVPLTQYYSEQD